MVRQLADGSYKYMFTVYALWNEMNDKIYIGQTDNIERRLQQHQMKLKRGSYSARISGDWKLAYKEEKETRKDALFRERELKSCKGREFIRQQIVKLK